MTEEGGLSEGRRPRLLEAARPERAEAPSPGRVGLTCESSVLSYCLFLDFSQLSFKYPLNNAIL